MVQLEKKLKQKNATSASNWQDVIQQNELQLFTGKQYADHTQCQKTQQQ